MMEFTNDEIRRLLRDDMCTASERASALYALAVTSKYSLQEVPDDLEPFNAVGQIALNSRFMARQVNRT